jgi:hypothetical protein
LEPADVSVTVAVKVTDWPKTEGLTEELTAVAVVAGVTVKAAVLLVVPVPPSFEVIAPVVLSFVPAVAPNTLTDSVQVLVTGSVPPDKLSDGAPATGAKVPPQVLVAPGGDATTTPAGKLSVNPIPVSATFVFGLAMLKVKVLVAPTRIVVGLNALLMVGGVATVRVAVAAAPLPPSVELTGPVLLR